MRTLEEDLKIIEESRRILPKKKSKPNLHRSEKPDKYDYEMDIAHFRYHHYDKKWVYTLTALLDLLGVAVPYRKRGRYRTRVNIHVWVLKCVEAALREGIINEEEAGGFLKTMEFERYKARSKLPIVIDYWNYGKNPYPYIRSDRELDRIIDGQQTYW